MDGFPYSSISIWVTPPPIVDLIIASRMTEKHINHCFADDYQYINFNKYIGINFAI